jgi:hypothetical protein
VVAVVPAVLTALVLVLAASALKAVAAVLAAVTALVLVLAA